MLERFRGKVFIVCFSMCLVMTGCTTGQMEVREIHYYAVPNGENTNYYRLRVKADTKLGVAEYRTGWYPARSVDALFGEVSSEGGVQALEVRSQIEKQINESILSTNEAWLKAASKPDAEPATLERLQRARRRVLAYPTSVGPPFEGAFEIEYNPARGVNTRYSDEKLVFILASDPDEVVGKIANFSESDQTVLQINKLAQVMEHRFKNDIAAAESVEDINIGVDNLILKQIEKARKVAEDPGATRVMAVREIDTLLILLNSVYP